MMGFKPLRILVVEDELIVAWHLGDVIHELGHTICDTVATEEAAIEATVRLKPDVILMDYRLASRGDGVSAARRIRELGDIPIIFCTAYRDGVEAKVESLANTYLIGKPVNSSFLKDALRHFSSLRSPEPGPATR